MTQDRLTLAITSFFIVALALIYVINPPGVQNVYANERTYFDRNEDGFIEGEIHSSKKHALTDVPVTIRCYDDQDQLIHLDSGKSDKKGKFIFKINKRQFQVFRQHKIKISFALNGQTFQQTIRLTPGDKTFNQVFTDHQFLPFPAFTVFVY